MGKAWLSVELVKAYFYSGRLHWRYYVHCFSWRFCCI